MSATSDSGELTATASYQLDSAGCSRSVPELVAVASLQEVHAAGAIATYSLTLENLDSAGCADGVFDLSSELGAEWSLVAAPVTLAPGAKTSLLVSVSSPSTEPVGTTAFAVTASQRSDPAFSASELLDYTIVAAAPDAGVGPKDAGVEPLDAAVGMDAGDALEDAGVDASVGDATNERPANPEADAMTGGAHDAGSTPSVPDMHTDTGPDDQNDEHDAGPDKSSTQGHGGCAVAEPGRGRLSELLGIVTLALAFGLRRRRVV
ncbi:MAG: hypothetical protein QM778_34830 [Myxococcales bacterium]